MNLYQFSIKMYLTKEEDGMDVEYNKDVYVSATTLENGLREIRSKFSNWEITNVELLTPYCNVQGMEYEYIAGK